ncbi:MAG TPA: tripartite tricarboxylate transporter substrate binding protein, partial [Burkholderiales bacterium]|nr:tripartite tricarboxylate transporter substrate binding protein [Burkholderiales bacterium]
MHRRVLLLAALATPALAQPRWPSRPLRFVVPFAPGGPVELPARLIADHLTSRLRQPVVVELKPGAAGAIGCREVAQA